MPRILITGANGQLGNELRAASGNHAGHDFVFTDVEALDIGNERETDLFINRTRPDWIVNCAAYNLVDQAESEPDAATLINSTGVGNLRAAISGSQCRLIHVSSDYVLDGRANIPYREDAATNPLSVYGRSKLGGETHALLHHASMVIRTSWLHSPFRKNFVKTILGKAGDNRSLQVVFDQTGTPTYAADLADAIMGIISGVSGGRLAFVGGIYNYSNEGVCSWYDLAVEIVREAGLSCHVIPVLGRDLPLTAPRPAYSVLDKSKIREKYGLAIPHWRASLARCLRRLKQEGGDPSSQLSTFG